MAGALSILHTESSTGWGGQEIRILTEARGMLDRGHRATLVTPREAPIHDAAAKLGIPVVALPIGRKRPGALYALGRWLARHGREFSVCNTHSSTDSWLVALVRAMDRDVAPIVRTRHVSTPLHDRAATRWLYLRATAHVVTTGEAIRLQLHRENGFPLDRMTSVATGIDLSRFRPLPHGEARASLGVEDRPTLGIVATLRDWKGHDELFVAFARLRAAFPQWRLIVIGDGPDRAPLEARARSLGLADAVRFVGNREDVPQWLAALDLFVLPSWGSEGVPQAIMQAMACALPVVSTTIGGIPEAVHDGETGLLVTPRDPVALADALAELMNDEPRRRALGAAGRARALETFGIEPMLDRMEAVFRRFARP